MYDLITGIRKCGWWNIWPVFCLIVGWYIALAVWLALVWYEEVHEQKLRERNLEERRRKREGY